jgi:hypothetical protein
LHRYHWRKTVNEHGCLKPFAAACIGMVMAVTIASSAVHAEDASAARCPPGYWLLEPVCIDQSSGDVVKASPAKRSPSGPAPGCAPSYERLGRLCIGLQTGDIELADEQRWPR